MRTLLSLAMLATLAGCTVGPDYRAAPASAPAALARGRFLRAADPALEAAPALARWWEPLGDATLDRLVEDALAGSPSIDVAVARIRQARAQLRQQEAGRRPGASASATYVHADLPGLDLTSSEGSGSRSGDGDSSSFDFYNLGLTASWEPDLFGGGRRTLERSRATVEARFAALADAQVTLTAQVARAYVDLRDAQEQVRLATASIDLERRALDLARQRFAAGTVSALDVERLRAQLDTVRSQGIPLAARIEEDLDQLAVLTGREPGARDAALAPPAPVPLPPASVAIGDPAALLARRPDIRAAERTLAASTAAIGVAQARLLPGVRFLGILGLGGTSPGDVFALDKLTTVAAPMLNWSLLDFGKGRAVVRQSEAQHDEAEAQYRQTVLGALQDAETALSRFGYARRRVGQLAGAEASAARSAALNDQRVRAGTSAVGEQLDIERQRLSAALALAQAKAQLTLDYIAVQKSLGLGWRDVPPDRTALARR